MPLSYVLINWLSVNMVFKEVMNEVKELSRLAEVSACSMSIVP
jgi:hypothetical protein